MPRILVGIAALMTCSAQSSHPPTRTDPVTETLHGVTLSDPYRWLEDQNSPATREWLTAQIKYAHDFLDDLPGREVLRTKFEAMLKIDSMGTPTVRSGRYFFSRRMASEDRASLMLRHGIGCKDEVLVDPETAT